MRFVPYITFTTNATILLLIYPHLIAGFAISKYVVINIPVYTPLYIVIFLFLDNRVLEILPNLWIVKVLGVPMIYLDLKRFHDNNSHNGGWYLLNIHPRSRICKQPCQHFIQYSPPSLRYILSPYILWSTKQIWVLSREIRREVTIAKTVTGITRGDESRGVMTGELPELAPGAIREEVSLSWDGWINKSWPSTGGTGEGKCQDRGSRTFEALERTWG